MSREFHKIWLKVAAIVVMSFAPVFFLGTMASTSGPAQLALDVLSWPVNGDPVYNHSSTHFISALTAGFLLGWGIMIWCLSLWVYDFAPEGVRKTLLLSAISWFLLDSTGSVLSGYGINVIPNILVLFLVVGPMWRPALEDRTAQ